MTRPNKRILTALLVLRTKPRERAFLIWDCAAAGGWPCGWSRPAKKALQVYLQSRSAARDGTTWGRPTRSTCPWPAAKAADLAKRVLVDGEDPQARARGAAHRRHVRAVGRPVPGTRQAQGPKLAAGAGAGRALFASALGQAAGDRRATRRRAGADGAHQGSDSSQPDPGRRQRDLYLGHSRGAREGQSGLGWSSATPLRSRERVLSDQGRYRCCGRRSKVSSRFASAALRVLLLTGQRPGEVAHMRAEHVVRWLVDDARRVRAEERGWPGTKNGATHRVWLPRRAQELVRFLTDENEIGPVFDSVSEKKMQKVMREICKRCGMEPVRPHDLRRTHGTTVASLGLGRDIINRIQNHREGGIGDVYDRHGYAGEIQSAMEAVAARLLALAEGKSAENVLPFAR